MFTITLHKTALLITVATLIFSGGTFAMQKDLRDDNLIEDVRDSRAFVSETVIVGGDKITISAPYYIDISVMLPERPDNYGNSDEFLAEFEKSRQEYYPDDEIHLSIAPLVSQRASGYLYLKRYWAWNVQRSFEESFGYSVAYPKGVITVIRCRAGVVRLQLRAGNTWYNRNEMSTGMLGFNTFNGNSNIYGGRGKCFSYPCVFDIMAFFPY